MLVYLTINLAVFRRASRAVPCEHQFLLAVPCRARLGFRRLLPTLIWTTSVHNALISNLTKSFEDLEKIVASFLRVEIGQAPHMLFHKLCQPVRRCLKAS